MKKSELIAIIKEVISEGLLEISNNDIISESTKTEQIRSRKLFAAVKQAYEACDKNTDKSQRDKLAGVWQKAIEKAEEHTGKVMAREDERERRSNAK